jgi:hypothetical protein
MRRERLQAFGLEPKPLLIGGENQFIVSAKSPYPMLVSYQIYVDKT